MFKVLFVVLVCSLFTISVNANEIKSIAISKEGKVDKESVLVYSGVQVGQRYGIDITSDEIYHNLYNTGYFANIFVNFNDGVLNLDLVENPSINKVYVDGSKMFTYDKVKEFLQTKERGIYTRSKLKTDAQSLQQVLQQSGYVNAIVEPKIVILQNNRVDVVFEVSDGERTTIEKMIINGNNYVKYSKLQEIGGLVDRNSKGIFAKGDVYEAEKVAAMSDKIVNFYNENGFLDMKIDSINTKFSRDKSVVMIEINITEGLQYSIGDVYIDYRNKKLFDNFKYSVKSGAIYNIANINSDKNEINNILYNNGTGYATTKENTIKKGGNLVDIVYRVSDDDYSVVSNIVIKGNTSTKDYIIRRELLLSEGSVIIEKDLQRSKNRLMSLGYFKNIDVKAENVNGKMKNIVVTVEEDGRRSMIHASAGYSSFEKQVIGLGLSLPNIKGYGKDLSVDVSTSRISKRVNLGLYTARFGNSRFGGGINFGVSNFDPTSYGINYKANSYYISPTLSYRLGDNLFYSTTYSYRNDNLENSPSANAAFLRQLLLDQFKHIITSSVTNAITYDTRDNFVLPNSGTRLSYSNTIAGLGGDQEFVRNDVEMTLYRGLISKSMPFMFSVKGGTMKKLGNNDILFQNRYAVWYYNMRGFGYGGLGPRLVETKENGQQYVDTISYRGNNYAIVTLEQHFPIPLFKESGARWYFFSDFGTLYGFDGKSMMVNSLGNTEQIKDQFMIRNATGVGISIPTPFGLISFDYAAKVRASEYDDIQKFRISLGGMPLN